MENLNAETIKKALASLMADCGKCANERHSECGLFCAAYKIFWSDSDLSTCDERCKDYAPPYIYCVLKDVFALINSQEQRIGELEAECEQWRSDWEENQKQWEIAYDKLESENARLTEEVAEEKAKGEMCAEVIKRLTEENERLKADTIDEFVKMVKEKMREVATGKRTSLIGTGWIDEIARELKGE